MSPFNVFRKPLTVTRPAAGIYVDGLWVDGATSSLEIKASVQPATTDDLQSLPENRRQLGAYRLYSDSPFQSAKEGVQNPDLVVIHGDTYEIAQSEPWKNGVVELIMHAQHSKRLFQIFNQTSLIAADRYLNGFP